LITELRPAALEKFGVRAAIETLAQRVGHRYGLQVDLEIDRESEHSRLTEEIEFTIYRFVQEAITNARKHAGVGRVLVAITEDSTHICVVVSDEGVGFEVAQAGTGVGLLGLRERLSLVGAQLEVESAPGAGTKVRARIPVVNRPVGDGDRDATW
jgi:two-component system sensor histidine kinase NreB